MRNKPGEISAKRRQSGGGGGRSRVRTLRVLARGADWTARTGHLLAQKKMTSSLHRSPGTSAADTSPHAGPAGVGTEAGRAPRSPATPWNPEGTEATTPENKFPAQP